MSAWRCLLHVLVVSSALMLLASAVVSPGWAEKPPPDVTADSLSAAARMSDEIQISPSVWPSDYDNYLPAAAYSAKHHQFLIVWQRKRTDGCREIWGRRIAEGGSCSASSISPVAPAHRIACSQRSPTMPRRTIIWSSGCTIGAEQASGTRTGLTAAP